MSNIAGRPTMSTNTSDEVGGSAAETFAIGFAIGGTLLLAGVILILALQARRKSFKAFFRRKKTSIQRPLVSTKSSTTNTNGHIPLETVPPPSTSRFSRLSNFANGSLNCFSTNARPGSLNCFQGTLERQSTPSPVPLSISPLPSNAPGSLPRPINDDREYSDPMVYHQSTADTAAMTLGTTEYADPHTYADPDRAGRASPDDVEEGLAYGSISVMAAQKTAVEDRKQRATTMHFEDGPYRTTSLARATSLGCVATASSQEAGLYLVRPVPSGSWNKRVSPSNAATVPTPGHRRTSSEHAMCKRNDTKVDIRDIRPFLSLERGPARAASLSNLLDDAKSKSKDQRNGVRSLPQRRLTGTKRRPPLPPKMLLASNPPKPPRVRHVDPDYIFVHAQRAAERSPNHEAVDGQLPHRPLRSCRSVPSRLHKRSSTASHMSGSGVRRASVMMNAIPQPMIRMASSEQIELPAVMRQPSEAFIAEPLTDANRSAGCRELKGAFTVDAPTTDFEPEEQEGAAIYAVLECDNDQNDDVTREEIDGFQTGPCNAGMGRRTSSLPDLASLASMLGRDRVKDRWEFRMSAVREGSREDSDISRQASLEQSLQQRQARALFSQKRGSALDKTDMRRRSLEPDYWILESQGSRDSIASMS